MSVYKTTKQHHALHCHVGPPPLPEDCGCCALIDWSAAQIAQQRAWMALHHPQAVEIGPPTRKFNCHGYAYANSHGWFCDPEIFLNDDFHEINMSLAQPGDVLIYRDDNNEITHSAIVNEVANGLIQNLRSKFGDRAVVRHIPADVDLSYGAPAQLFRRNASHAHSHQRRSVHKKDSDMEESISKEEIQNVLKRLADPEVNLAVNSASTLYVAKRIIQQLPGVEDLKRNLPGVEDALLEALEGEESLSNENFVGIVLHILKSYPTERVKLRLAKLVLDRRLFGRNVQLAVEAFLRVANIDPEREGSVEVAQREAHKLLDKDGETERPPMDQAYPSTDDEKSR